MYEDAKKYEGNYLSSIKLIGHLKKEPIKKDNITVIVPGRNAITVNIEINDSSYCKTDIKKELEQIFNQILNYFDK